MRKALWITQVLLAAIFFMAGGMKIYLPMDQLIAHGMSFVEQSPAWLVRFIGFAEVLGAIGLVLPAALRIQPKLTPIAAGLLTFVMVLAAGTHMLMDELVATWVPIIVGLLTAFVAWGRWYKEPILPRAGTGRELASHF
jgi:putative oxidoreductase